MIYSKFNCNFYHKKYAKLALNPYIFIVCVNVFHDYILLWSNYFVASSITKIFSALIMLFLMHQSLFNSLLLNHTSVTSLKKAVITQAVIMRGGKCRTDIAGALWITWSKPCIYPEKTSDLQFFQLFPAFQIHGRN